MTPSVNNVPGTQEHDWNIGNRQFRRTGRTDRSGLTSHDTSTVVMSGGDAVLISLPALRTSEYQPRVAPGGAFRGYIIEEVISPTRITTR